MSDGPIFTVVMATYNRGWHVIPSVKSVLRQSLQDFHLLVVGDCCDDDTGDAVASLGSPRVSWINLGSRFGSQSGPNNYGIGAATGRYVAYIGHDDIWCPDHLEALTAVFSAPARPDFAVSGTIFHMPPGVDAHEVTGIFSDDAAKFTHFFPPSGLAHRRSALDAIGGWKRPETVKAPVDADMLLRAAHAGLTFASTERVTVHKFAAGHRYLSYIRQCSSEQEEMLERVAEPGHADWLRGMVERARQQGTFMIMGYPDFDLLEPGQLAARNAAAKGLRGAAVVPLARRMPLAQPEGALGVDWQARSPDGLRWVGLNPKPRLLVPFTADRPAQVQMLIAHSRPEDVSRLVVHSGGTPLAVGVSPARRVGDHWEAAATFEVPLAPDGPTILELDLKAEQCASRTRRGLGIGEMVIDPQGMLGPDAIANILCDGLLRRGSAATMPVGGAAGATAAELAAAREELAAARAALSAITRSRSWRLTEPLRWAATHLRQLASRVLEKSSGGAGNGG